MSWIDAIKDKPKAFEIVLIMELFSDWKPIYREAFWTGEKWCDKDGDTDFGKVTYWVELPHQKDNSDAPENPFRFKYFRDILREEFLVNTQNYPKEYHKLFKEKFERAEKLFNEQ